MTDEAEKWLRENDPEYTNYKNRRNSEYPFHSNRQNYLRTCRETPVSSFNGKYTRKIALGNGNHKIDTKERPYGVLSYLG